MAGYIFWDLDGTITQSEGGIISSVRYALEKMNALDSVPESELRKFIGPSLYDSFTTKAHMSDEDAGKAIVLYREAYEKTGLYDAIVYDGVPEAMEKLKSEGYRHAVVTSKPLRMAERVLEHFGIRPLLDTVIGPTPEDHSSDKEKLIRSALKYFNTDSSQAVMIGDRCYDIDGAKAAGIYSIGVLYGYGSRKELEDSGADVLAETPADIPSALHRLEDIINASGISR